MRSFRRRLPTAYKMFNYFTPFYEWLVNNPFWRASVKEIARHLPPSGAELRLLDVGCGPANSALTLVSLRLDVRVIGVDGSTAMIARARVAVAASPHPEKIRLSSADALRLPFAANSFDAIMLHSVYYMLDDQPRFLAEALRVLRPGGRLIMLDPAAIRFPLGAIRKNLRAAPAVFVWQSVSYAYHRYTPESIALELQAAGFARILGERAVEGYGILSRGEKPYPDSSPITRTQKTAALDDSPATGLLTPKTDLDALKRRSVFLLIRQTPNKPAWDMKPGEAITWGAAAILDPVGGQPVALAFSSLPKAVEFMQAAVTANLIVGVSKVAKFDKASAAIWDFPIMLNPSLDSLKNTPTDLFIGVDPNTAITGEE